MLKTFDVSAVDNKRLPPEAVEVAVALAKIENQGTRKEVAQAILTLVRKHFE